MKMSVVRETSNTELRHLGSLTEEGQLLANEISWPEKDVTHKHIPVYLRDTSLIIVTSKRRRAGSRRTVMRATAM